jgi:DNA mismatch repair ATPase MutS
MARAQVKRAQREENAGKTKYGMDVKPRQQLDEKVIERAKELTAQEKNNIARKEAIEFGQRRESDKRAIEGLKARDKMIKNKMKKMSPQQKQNYINYLRESGW